MSLNGIDISGWDSGIDVINVTADFIIIKVTEGLQGPIYNKEYRSMADGTLSSGKLLGFYHYANGEDPVKEANSFYESIKDYKGKAIPCLDWEGYGNRLFDSGEDVAWCKAFLDRIANLMSATPFFYTGKSECNAYDWSSVARKYPLWGAEYAYDDYVYQGYEDDPWQSNYAWGAWGHNVAIHQYGYVNPKPNNGGQAQLDGDKYYGTKTDWINMCGGRGDNMALREKIVAAARSQLGQPYNSMTYGTDGSGWGCAMLCAYAHNSVLGTDYYGSVYNFAGDALGQSVNQGGGEFIFTDDPKPGDIVLYMPAGYNGKDYDDYGHAALYIGNGKVIGAWGKGNIGNSNYWAGRGVSEDRVEEQSLGGDWRYVTCTRLNVTPKPKDIPNGGNGAVYRLHDISSGAHFYTASHEEAKQASVGMDYEGIGWYVSNNGTDIYRLYNPSNGDHLFTASKEEKESASKFMNYEGIAFKTSGNAPVYRLYDKNTGFHFYTASIVEKDAAAQYMNYEGVAFYASGITKQDDAKKPTQPNTKVKNNNGLKYRSHIQTAGWLPWVADGQTSGSEGFGKRLECIEINIPKDVEIDVHLHAQGIGWITAEINDKHHLIIGTIGQQRRIEAIKVHIIKWPERFKNKDIYYQTHCQSIGWDKPKKSGQISGTVGKSKRMEAFRMWIA